MNDEEGASAFWQALGVMLIAAALVILIGGGDGAPEVGTLSAPVPTLMPTPALVVPPPPPLQPTAPPAVYIERVESGGQVTVNQTTVDIDVCILARCP